MLATVPPRSRRLLGGHGVRDARALPDPGGAPAVATGGAWIFYFADAPTLARDFFAGDAAPVAYTTVAILTATTFVFGGFLREQVCIYMCPWPRIQAAMLDEDSLVVTYNDWRGEPRAAPRGGLRWPGARDLGAACEPGEPVRPALRILARRPQPEAPPREASTTFELALRPDELSDVR